MTPAVLDESEVLQMPGGHSDALTPSTQHVCNELLGHQQFGATNSVLAKEQPSAETLFDRVKAIAHGRLGNLRQQGLRVAQQHRSKVRAMKAAIPYCGGGHGQRLTFSRNDCATPT